MSVYEVDTTHLHLAKSVNFTMNFTPIHWQWNELQVSIPVLIVVANVAIHYTYTRYTNTTQIVSLWARSVLQKKAMLNCEYSNPVPQITRSLIMTDSCTSGEYNIFALDLCLTTPGRDTYGNFTLLNRLLPSELSLEHFWGTDPAYQVLHPTIPLTRCQRT